jgi:hypothetical protein
VKKFGHETQVGMQMSVFLLKKLRLEAGWMIDVVESRNFSSDAIVDAVVT